MVRREVHPSDFSEKDLQDLVQPIKRLTWTLVGGDVPDWVREEAERFAALNPKPDDEELRLQVQHAVAVARGWDDPDDRIIMLHTALKSFYLLRWIEHLETAAKRQGLAFDPRHIQWAARVSFSPVLDKTASEAWQRGQRPPQQLDE